MELPIAAAWCALGKLATDDAVQAAHAALEQGVFSESLAAVTFADPQWSEVGPLFQRALEEQGVEIPDPATAVQRLARNFASRIVAGELSPYEGARIIWKKLAYEPAAGDSLLSFVGFASEWEDHPESRREYDAEILSEARRLAAHREWPE